MFEHLNPEQAGLRLGKSTASQVGLLNLTHHIENGLGEGMVTGVVFVDLSTDLIMVSHGEVCLSHFLLTYAPMTNLELKRFVDLSMQMTSV